MKSRREHERTDRIIDRYVEETVGLLPRRARAEAERDLRARIESRIEQARQSRPAAPDELAAFEEVLRALGPPEVVAAELRPGRDWLIAPHLVRPFVTAVSIALSALVVLTVSELLTGPGGVSGEEGNLLDLLLRAVAAVDDLLLEALLVVVGLVALFVFLDRTVEGEEAVRERWSVRRLTGEAAKDPDRVGRFGAILEMALAGVGLAILHGTSFEPGVMVTVGDESGWVPLRIPALSAQLLWIDLWLAGTIALDAFLLWRGRWSAGSRLAEAGLTLVLAWVAWRLRSAARLLAVDTAWMAENGWSAEAIASYQETLGGSLDDVLRMALAGVVAVCLLGAALEVFQAVRTAWRGARRGRRK